MSNPNIACPYCYAVTQAYRKDNVMKISAHDRPDGPGCPMSFQPLVYRKDMLNV